MEKKVLVPVAEESEELETIVIVDTLRRAGAKVILSSVESHLEIHGHMGTTFLADKLIDECEGVHWDMIVCPGGKGASRLQGSPTLKRILEAHVHSSRPVGAICAAPAVVLSSLHLLKHHRATCYPSSKYQSAISNFVDQDVVVDGNFITSKGPGTALPFALQLVEVLYGESRKNDIANQMVYAGEVCDAHNNRK